MIKRSASRPWGETAGAALRTGQDSASESDKVGVYMRIGGPARKHGIPDADIWHGIATQSTRSEAAIVVFATEKAYRIGGA